MQTINQFLNSKITEKSLLLKKLNAVILPLLPDACHSHIKATNYSNQELVLIVDSPVWAARLRTQHKSITTSLQNELNFPVTSFKIKFHQPEKKKLKAKTKPARLSSDSAALINQTAKTIEDEELKAALLRLSKNANQ